jgi:hypothetical protein
MSAQKIACAASEFQLDALYHLIATEIALHTSMTLESALVWGRMFNPLIKGVMLTGEEKWIALSRENETGFSLKVFIENKHLLETIVYPSIRDEKGIYNVDTSAAISTFSFDLHHLKQPALHRGEIVDWLTNNHAHQIRVSQRNGSEFNGVDIDLVDANNHQTGVYIEIDDGVPCIHISSDPENDNDVHIKVKEDSVEVVAESSQRITESTEMGLVMASARTLNNDDEVGPR